MASVTKPRFPDIPAKSGHYESFYAKLADPKAPRGVWIRYTVHKQPGAPHEGSLWFTLFDREAGAPHAVKVTLGADQTTAPADGYIRIGDATFSASGLSGSAEAEGRSATWDLTIDSSEEPYRHLPKPWMYTAGLPKTKLLSPHPGARYSGHVTVDGRQIDIQAWPGMVGHNWGRQHAERWIWSHGDGFEGLQPGEAWFDGAFGRIKLGPLTTPWIANACLSLEGKRYILGGPARARGTKVMETPEKLEFILPGEEATLTGTFRSPRSDIVCWVYADPDGPEHNTANCSIAELEMTVSRPGSPDLDLKTTWGATYELGMREKDHGLKLQPFPDG